MPQWLLGKHVVEGDRVRDNQEARSSLEARGGRGAGSGAVHDAKLGRQLDTVEQGRERKEESIGLAFYRRSRLQWHRVPGVVQSGQNRSRHWEKYS
jgi:hypothetical protein